MLLADLGAEVVKVDRVGGSADPLRTLMGRNRRSIAIDLRHGEGRAVALRLIDTADVLLEGMRPGVAERLGVGPGVCLVRNPGLVYGRMTGWGQDGPNAARAGHDIDYIAATGALHAIGATGAAPPPPLNLVADFGGGALYLAFGVLAAVVERATSGLGQVVDAAMIDGVSSLLTMFHEMRALGLWSDRRHANLLDGGAPFYATYQTADGEFVAIGALEPQFYDALLERLGLDPAEVEDRRDPSLWPALRTRLERVFAARTRAEWMDVFAGSDACVEPVVTMAEAPHHPQLAWRGTFVKVGGTVQPGPAPRFDRTPAGLPSPAVAPGHDTDAVLGELGYDAAEVEGLRHRSAVG